MNSRIAPNFFVVGAMKAGTTSIYRYLDQHPAIYMSPIKEPHFFSPEVLDYYSPESKARFDANAAALQMYLDSNIREARQAELVLDWEQYLKLFKHARNETAIGEASVSYLGSTIAPGAIRARIPNARIIMMLRDPMERLFSLYSIGSSTGNSGSAFLQWVEERMAAEARYRSPFPAAAIWAGRYALHLKRYLEYFAWQQMRVYLYDEYAREPTSILRDMFAFLGVDPSWPVDTTRRYNVSVAPRWPSLHRVLAPPARRAIRAILPARVGEHLRRWYFTPRRVRPTREERARVIEIYRDDIRTLETLIQRDLSAWLDPNRLVHG